MAQGTVGIEIVGGVIGVRGGVIIILVTGDTFGRSTVEPAVLMA